MARFTLSGRTNITPTTTLPGVSLYATASVRPRVVELSMWNTTATACVMSWIALTSAGTQGTSLASSIHKDDDENLTAISVPYNGHTAAPTLGAEIRRADLGAAIGSGVIWTFGGGGLVIPTGTANGVGLICATGTGQIVDYHVTWIE
jgi:hypothetical protein